MLISDYFKDHKRHPGANETRAREICAALHLTPPDDYLSALAFTDGAEGFIGESYLRFYCIAWLRDLNPAYQVEKFAPGLVIFATNGGGDAYAFDTRSEPHPIVRVPLIPLDYQYVEPLATDFSGFLRRLAGDSPASRAANPELFGVELHYIKPLIFGGSPTDRANMALLPSEKHAEYCVYWNNLYHSITAGQP